MGFAEVDLDRTFGGERAEYRECSEDLGCGTDKANVVHNCPRDNIGAFSNGGLIDGLEEVCKAQAAEHASLPNPLDGRKRGHTAPYSLTRRDEGLP